MVLSQGHHHLPKRSFSVSRRNHSVSPSIKRPAGPVRTESTLSCSRLEKAIANRKPTGVKADPATNFWTVYKKVAEEHDNGMVSQYIGDLDTSLLFVSRPTSPECLISLIQVLFPH